MTGYYTSAFSAQKKKNGFDELFSHWCEICKSWCCELVENKSMGLVCLAAVKKKMDMHSIK